jgi:hypothetical protein
MGKLLGDDEPCDVVKLAKNPEWMVKMMILVTWICPTFWISSSNDLKSSMDSKGSTTPRRK